MTRLNTQVFYNLFCKVWRNNKAYKNFFSNTLSIYIVYFRLVIELLFTHYLSIKQSFFPPQTANTR